MPGNGVDLTGSGTIEGHDRARPAWWRAGAGVSAEFTDRLAAPAAFVVTGVSIGLLAADQGGYFPGAWRLATPFYAAVVVAILAGARELRVPRAALVTVAGLAGPVRVDGGVVAVVARPPGDDP